LAQPRAGPRLPPALWRSMFREIELRWDVGEPDLGQPGVFRWIGAEPPTLLATVMVEAPEAKSVLFLPGAEKGLSRRSSSGGARSMQ
jgi:hypothetical protein